MDFITATATTTTTNTNKRATLLVEGLLLLVLVIASAASVAQAAELPPVPQEQQDQQQQQLLDGGGRLANQQRENLRQAAAPTFRFRRHANTPKPAQIQALLEGDEQVLRRQLPDLIAQAHQDKNVERALLRMLINASLRSGLSNMVGQQQAAGSSAGGNNWQLDNDNTLTQYNQVGGEFVPVARSARLQEQQQQPTDLAQLDNADLSSLTATIQQLNGQLQPLLMEQQQQQQQQQLQQPFQPAMDKREYIKPCSFNAISCVRTPFRRL